MGALEIALLGGAVGSLIAIAAGAGARISAVPGEIRSNDRRAADRDADIEQWIVDETAELRRALAAERERLNKDNLFYSGAYGVGLAGIKESSLHAYRDQETQARRDLATIYEREGWIHNAWRAITRNPRLALTAPERAAKVLDAWRLPATRHLAPGDQPRAIDDPTARTLDATIVDVTTNPGDFQ